MAVPGENGLYHPGVIQAVKTLEQQILPLAELLPPDTVVPGPARNTSHYSVRLDLTQKLREHPDSDIIGPGFAGLIGIKLQTRTRCYVTYCNREIQLSLGY